MRNRNLIKLAYGLLPLIILAHPMPAKAGNVFPPTNVSSCNDGDSLVFKKNATTGDMWIECGSSSVPSGAITYFLLSSCPTGWVPANGTSGTVDLRGEFIRGWDNGRGVDSGRGLSSWQAATAIGNLVWQDVVVQFQNADSAYAQGNYVQFNGLNCCGGNSTWYTVRPRNVALLACQKQ